MLDTYYAPEFIDNPNGIACRVLRAQDVDFSSARRGVKSAITLVRPALEGEHIVAKNSSDMIETVYVARAGEAVFFNIHNHADSYVPVAANGQRLLFDALEDNGYEVLGPAPSGNALEIRSNKIVLLLHEAIQQPTCIQNPWGCGMNQFLFSGATLRKDPVSGRVTGIDKEAFDATWKLL